MGCTYLDKLICHLRRDVDALHVVLTGLAVFALRGESVRAGQVLVPTFLALRFGPLLRRQRAAVENHVRSYAVMLQQANAMHGVVDISGNIGGA